MLIVPFQYLLLTLLVPKVATGLQHAVAGLMGEGLLLLRRSLADLIVHGPDIETTLFTGLPPFNLKSVSQYSIPHGR